MPEKGRQTAVELTKQLVRIDSTDPGAGEGGMERFLLDLARLWNVEAETAEALPGRRNVMLTLPGAEQNRPLVFICHMDTVPVGEGWQESPFGAEERDGRIYGRGSCDMKSGFACALSAFAAAVEAVRQGAMPRRTLKLIATVDEEGDMHGAEQVIRSGWVSRDSLILDTEPTNGAIQGAHKGRVWFAVTVRGVTAHASTPWKGADAIAAMAETISGIRRRVQALPPHPEMGPSTVCFGRISGGSAPYVVSGDCRVTIDMRLTPPYTSRDAAAWVEAAMGEAGAAVPGVEIVYEIPGDRPAVALSADSRLLAELQAACEAVTGRPAQISVFPGYTDTAVLAGRLGNPDCMSYGPGSLELAHKPDEFVPVADILRCEAVLTELVRRFVFDAAALR